MSHLRRHAVVLGASMSGLLNAAVLARHFEQVTLVERDRFDDQVVVRKGVPQGRHVHGFWHRGMQIVEQLLPGTRAELLSTGAVSGDCGSDFHWHQFGATKLRVHLDIPAMIATRPHFEAVVRRRVVALSNVRLRDGTRVVKPIAAGTTVCGVEVETATNARELIAADLVLDSTGRAGLATKWIEELGFRPPRESQVRIDVSYTTRAFKRTAPASAIAYLASTTPPEGRRGAVAFAVEGDRWLVSLAGFVGEQPPEDLPGFTEYARSLPVPEIHEIVARCEPIGEPARFRFPSDRRRHYERLDDFPEGLLVSGDALACFNPAYGQGMTVAALEAEALDQELSAHNAADPLYSRFFARAASIIDSPWLIATGEDLRHPGAVGRRPLGLSIANAYLARLHRAAATDRVVCLALYRVAGFQAHPLSIFSPSIAWRALRAPQLRSE